MAAFARHSVLSGLIACAGFHVSAQAAYPGYEMERTEVRDMVSETGEAYRILIQEPASPPPASGYPVLYLLDGEDNFAVAAATSERFGKYARDHGFEAGLIVGIGYEGESRRFYDYTPASSLQTDGRGRAVGGAGDFRTFVTETLRAAIKADFDVDPNRQSLFGHSYGGLFVLDTLLEDPSLFQTYVIASPSIWFGDRVVLEDEADLPGKLDGLSSRTVVLTVGETETRVPPFLTGDDGAASTRDEVEALARRLSAVGGLGVHQETLSGESHGSSVLPALGRAVMYAFAGAPL